LFVGVAAESRTGKPASHRAEVVHARAGSQSARPLASGPPGLGMRTVRERLRGPQAEAHRRQPSVRPSLRPSARPSHPQTPAPCPVERRMLRHVPAGLGSPRARSSKRLVERDDRRPAVACGAEETGVDDTAAPSACCERHRGSNRYQERMVRARSQDCRAIIVREHVERPPDTM
jgi:hypothetical protein